MKAAVPPLQAPLKRLRPIHFQPFVCSFFHGPSTVFGQPVRRPLKPGVTLLQQILARIKRISARIQCILAEIQWGLSVPEVQVSAVWGAKVQL
ncbi:MAG: hypothetical protein IJV24_08870 [Prevotella sp.]|nr:hypothetical protein [Prevotella sp.]